MLHPVPAVTAAHIRQLPAHAATAVHTRPHRAPVVMAVRIRLPPQPAATAVSNTT